jgi:ankyrin repeat protein
LNAFHRNIKNGHVDFFLFLLNYDVSVDNTDNDGQTHLRVAASNVHLNVPQDFLSNGGIVHIARKRDLTALLTAADSGQFDTTTDSS